MLKRRNDMAIKTYEDGTPFTGVIGRTTEESSPAWWAEALIPLD
jgi:hypothetical protein